MTASKLRKLYAQLREVSALMDRTRRLAEPPYAIDLDVFGARGRRAIKLHWNCYPVYLDRSRSVVICKRDM